MKFIALFVVALIASATADTAQFTFANSKLTKFQNAVAGQVSTATNSIVSSLNTEFSYLLGVKNYALNEINTLGNAQLTADVNALVNSIGAKIAAKFNPQTIASSILAPYLAKIANWYAQVSADIATLNTATPPVSLACLKAVEGSINGNITDLSSRVTNKVNQQLSIINPRFNTLNTAINADLSSVDANVASTCGNDLSCAAGAIEASLPAISAKADAYIQQNVDAFASDVATANTKAGELDAIFVNRYTWIGQDLAKCQAASA